MHVAETGPLPDRLDLSVYVRRSRRSPSCDTRIGPSRRSPIARPTVRAFLGPRGTLINQQAAKPSSRVMGTVILRLRQTSSAATKAAYSSSVRSSIGKSSTERRIGAEANSAGVKSGGNDRSPHGNSFRLFAYFATSTMGRAPSESIALVCEVAQRRQA